MRTVCVKSLTVFILAVLLVASPAWAFQIHSPQIVAQSVEGRVLAVPFGATTYGYERAWGTLVAIPAADACQPLSFDAPPVRNVTAKSVESVLEDRPLEGRIALVFYPAVRHGQAQTRSDRAVCSLAQSALWVQQRGASGLLIQKTPAADQPLEDATEDVRTGTSLSRLYGGAVTIYVEVISQDDAQTLRAAVEYYGLDVDVSMGVSLVEDYSYV